MTNSRFLQGWGPNFGPFHCSEIQHAQGRRKSKCTEWPQNWTWILNSQKHFTLNTYPWGLILVSFALRLAICEIQMYNMYKVGENRKCTEWPQTELEHLTVKSTLHTLNTYPWGPKFGPFHSKTNGFQDIAHFIIPTLKKKNKKKKNAKIPNFEISQFFIQLR